MKKIIKQNGRTITSLDDLVENVPVKVYEAYSIEDLPDRIHLSTALAVPRKVWFEMLHVLARENKIKAIKWVRELTGWGLASSKWFVDSLVNEPHDEIYTSILRNEIVLWCGETNTSRGYAYYKEGRVFDIARSGNTVTGLCSGSEETPYTVAVTFDKDGISSSKCSCPVVQSGCKHTAALLFEWRVVG